MSKLDEQLKENAQSIGKVVASLVEEGFSSEDAVKLTCAMLSSSHIYTPFAEMVTPGSSTIQ